MHPSIDPHQLMRGPGWGLSLPGTAPSLPSPQQRNSTTFRSTRLELKTETIPNAISSTPIQDGAQPLPSTSTFAAARRPA